MFVGIKCVVQDYYYGRLWDSMLSYTTVMSFTCIMDSIVLLKYSMYCQASLSTILVNKTSVGAQLWDAQMNLR